MHNFLSKKSRVKYKIRTVLTSEERVGYESTRVETQGSVPRDRVARGGESRVTRTDILNGEKKEDEDRIIIMLY